MESSQPPSSRREFPRWQPQEKSPAQSQLEEDVRKLRELVGPFARIHPRPDGGLSVTLARADAEKRLRLLVSKKSRFESCQLEGQTGWRVVKVEAPPKHAIIETILFVKPGPPDWAELLLGALKVVQPGEMA